MGTVPWMRDGRRIKKFQKSVDIPGKSGIIKTVKENKQTNK